MGVVGDGYFEARSKGRWWVLAAVLVDIATHTKLLLKRILQAFEKMRANQKKRMALAYLR